MKKVIFFILLSTVISPIFSQETKPELDEKPSREIEVIRLANNLAKHGYESFSALALIESASIFNDIVTRELDPVSYEKGDDNEEVATKKERPEFTVESLLADAVEFADGNESLLTLIEEVKEKAAAVTRGRVGGPARTVSRVNGNSYDIYEVGFIANEYAEVLVSGDGDTDLDLYVYDSNGNLIVKDDDYTDDCYVRWVPKWTGNFRIKILNRGPIYNEYVFFTN